MNLNRNCSEQCRFVKANSADDFDRMQRAPVAQRLLRGFRFEGVPAIDRAASGEQGLEFGVGAALAEEIADVVEIVRQELAGKVEHHRFAEPEFALVRERDVFLLIVDIVRQLVVHLLVIQKIGLIVYFTGPLADEGEKFTDAAARIGELEGTSNVRDTHWHCFRLPSDEVSFVSNSGI